jgi:hypothetical protein
MRLRLAPLVICSVLAGVLVAPNLAAADEERPVVALLGEPREEVENLIASALTLQLAQDNASRAAREGEGAGFDDEFEMPSSYPSQPTLPEPAPEPAGEDATTASGVLAHSDLAPMVNDWMAASDLVSAQIVGQSSQGRDLYLVTVTAPETTGQTAQQKVWKDKIKDDPVAAAADAALAAGYKTPLFFSGNIHGNEWEGTDAIMTYIGRLLDDAATPAVQTLVAEHRLYFYLTINPDGRTIGQRPGVLNLDINRDMITATTPEGVAFTKSVRAAQALYVGDLHGYTQQLQVEPCGPPHGDNYEYDLFIPHGYASALQVEEEWLDWLAPGGLPLPVPNGINIPYRDQASGWDDYPPIFTAQYAAYYGAVTATIELPLPRSGTGQTPITSAFNTEVGAQTITSLIDYVVTNESEILANQIEVFRRGHAGAPKVQLTGDNIADVPGPDQWKALWDEADDQNPVEYPRAYVIPVGDDQRSRTDADRLVRHLLFHDIEVGTLDAAATVGDKDYPAGSYIVDMHQPLRGLANALLDVGYDISDKVPSMYDVSAWSLGHLWGATVDPVGLTTGPSIGATTAITEPTAVAALGGDPVDTTFDLAGVPDYRALNDLLEAGPSTGEGDDTGVRMAPDGSVVVSYLAFDEAVVATSAHGVPLRAATPAEVAAAEGAEARTLSDLRVGYVGNQEETNAFTELGFDDLVPLTGAGINAASLDTIDVLWVGSSLGVTGGTAGDTALQAWVDEGNSILGRGTTGLAAAEQYDLVEATAASGSSSSNGIVALETPEGSPLKPYEQESGFVYPAVSFDAITLGQPAQTYAAADPFLAGHWTGTGNSAPEFAAGKASAIYNEIASGARSVVFGTTLLFRTHPKGGLSQAGRSLFWAASDPATALPEAPVVEPVATTTRVVQVGKTAYPDRARVRVTVAPATGSVAPTGTVTVRDAGGNLATGTLVGGTVLLDLPAVRPGQVSVTATYTPSGEAFTGSVSPAAAVVTSRALSRTRASVKQLKGDRIRVTTRITGPEGVPLPGKLRVKLNGKRVQVLTVDDDGKISFVLDLAKGKSRLTMRYTGNALIKGSSSGARTVAPLGR